jgi:hypothetical protein
MTEESEKEMAQDLHKEMDIKVYKGYGDVDRADIWDAADGKLLFTELPILSPFQRDGDIIRVKEINQSVKHYIINKHTGFMDRYKIIEHYKVVHKQFKLQEGLIPGAPTYDKVILTNVRSEIRTFTIEDMHLIELRDTRIMNHNYCDLKAEEIAVKQSIFVGGGRFASKIMSFEDVIFISRPLMHSATRLTFTRCTFHPECIDLPIATIQSIYEVRFFDCYLKKIVLPLMKNWETYSFKFNIVIRFTRCKFENVCINQKETRNTHNLTVFIDDVEATFDTDELRLNGSGIAV